VHDDGFHFAYLPCLEFEVADLWRKGILATHGGNVNVRTVAQALSLRVLLLPAFSQIPQTEVSAT
jgi:hypothetical protein